MPGGIFLLDADGGLTEMFETPFAAEVDFQKLLARHPSLLAGDQIDPGEPRRWLLVAREVGVPDHEQGGARWSLDHLFLDQDGVPTLVEVKRSSDPRIRREVVGQMLDYAAHSIIHWTAETIRGWYEERCEKEGLDADQGIANLTGGAVAADDLWLRVKTNLLAGRVRLLFVADVIPPELRRIVEFLNRQMDPAEVLAVELRQYAGGALKTLVPRVMGQTAGTLERKSVSSGPKHQWDEPTFLAELARRNGEADAGVARRILEWARDRGCQIWWGQGAQDGSFFPLVPLATDRASIFSVWTYGRIEIQFQWLRMKPPFDDEALRLELLDKLNALPGLAIPRDGIERRPSFPLRSLTAPGALEGFLVVMDWLVGMIRGA